MGEDSVETSAKRPVAVIARSPRSAPSVAEGEGGTWQSHMVQPIVAGEIVRQKRIYLRHDLRAEPRTPSHSPCRGGPHCGGL